ncbi:hypothetical protein J6590_084840 [Homalodisca vitripennis]|nr:hypothetical protein J6590_084840 [Homalodisca vitripennis]
MRQEAGITIAVNHIERWRLIICHRRLVQAALLGPGCYTLYTEPRNLRVRTNTFKARTSMRRDDQQGMHDLRSWTSKRFSKQQPVFKVVLIPCSMKRSSVEIKMKVYNLSRKGYHVILYRNHCSPPELISMARDIDAKHTVLIRPPAVTPLTEREKSLSFWSHLGDFHRIIQFSESIADETRQLAIAKDDDLEVSSAELQNAVECIIVDKEDHTVDLVDKTDSPRGSELSPPSSFILIDSDIVTVASNDTVLREGGLV